MSGTKTLFAGSYWDAAQLTEATTGRCGAAIQIIASAAGTVTLELWSGNSIVVDVVVGMNLFEYSVVKATVGTATITSYYNLFK